VLCSTSACEFDHDRQILQIECGIEIFAVLSSYQASAFPHTGKPQIAPGAQSVHSMQWGMGGMSFTRGLAWIVSFHVFIQCSGHFL
jgi:hypothetical protein